MSDEKTETTGGAEVSAAALLKDTTFLTGLSTIIGESVKTALTEAAKEPATDNAQKLFAPNVNLNNAQPDTRKGTELFGRMAACFFTAHQQTGAFAPDRAAKIAGDLYKDAVVEKAINTINFGEGGALVPTQYVDDIFEALRPNSVLRQMPITIIDMVDGNAVMPGITGGATASYKGENQAANATGITTGDVRLVEKELICIVPLTSSMMRSRSGRNAQAISNDMMRAIGQGEEVGLLTGAGTSNAPRGILNQIPAAQVTATAGTSLANVDTDMQSLQSTVRGANVAVTDETGGYLMDTTVDEQLLRLRTPSGDLKAFPELMNTPKRLGRYRAAAGNNMTAQRLLFANWPDIILAESQDIEFTVSTGAAYLDQNGVMQAPFSRNETVMRVVMKHDIGLRYTQAIAMKTGVNYTGA